MFLRQQECFNHIEKTDSIQKNRDSISSNNNKDMKYKNK